MKFLTHSVHNISFVTKNMLTLICCAAALAACQSSTHTHLEKTHLEAKTNNKHNVLFISIDDLRNELGAYGSALAQSPSIDLLASKGITFDRAYAQQAICGPSRASIMTGLRPDTLEVTHNYVKFRHKFKDVKTIPQHFMENGYNAGYVGKIFHHGDKDEENSWNWPAATHLLPAHIKAPGTYALEANNKLQDEYRKQMFAKYGEQAKYGLGRGPATEGADVPDYAYIDGYNAEVADKTLEQLAKQDKPFFFGFGMNKPHLPWIAPKKYWDLYDPLKIKAALAKVNQSKPKKGAAMGLHASFELRTFSDIPNMGEIPLEQQVHLMHSYLACISYIDAQIGRTIKKLEELNVLDSTVIVLWSDHGFHLSDKGIWGKASNYEIATRVPFIISTPQTRASGQALRTNALVELIDIYPTVSELANIPQANHVEGSSLVPLIKNPDLKWKDSALSQFPNPALREWGAYPLRPGMRETYFGELIVDVENRIKKQFPEKWDRKLFEQDLMGYSLRTDRYRLIAWMNTQTTSPEPLFVELYDHQNDPNENVNVAADQPHTVKTLMQKLTNRLQ
ncbi:sulfatase [Catenovulum sediminis]|uniref:Sulfatase n=1 Tax=Catenovulum sediminis TaxID=1740262 RepID=A0ABV1RCW6_9ALTE